MSKNKASAKRICAVCTVAVLIASVFTACGEPSTEVSDNSLPKSSSEHSVDKDESQKAPEVVMGKTVLSGKCGDNVTYTLDENGTLLISGTGEMYSYKEDDTPWHSSKNDIFRVIIESGVTNIGNSAFHSCVSLKSITIPDSVTSIGEAVFFQCVNLKNITIPDSVISIGDCAFFYCNSLESITIPNGITSIDDYVFSYCKELESVTIPNSVTSIEKNAFEHCEALADITIPNGVTNIEEHAFAYCESLASITVPDSVTSIGDYAFNDTAWYNNQADGLVYIGKVLYNYKGEMPANTSIEIKDGTLGIASYAFSFCESLVNVTIPDGVISIGELAFNGCDFLTIHAPKGSVAEKYANDNDIRFIAK